MRGARAGGGGGRVLFLYGVGERKNIIFEVGGRMTRMTRRKRNEEEEGVKEVFGMCVWEGGGDVTIIYINV